MRKYCFLTKKTIEKTILYWSDTPIGVFKRGFFRVLRQIWRGLLCFVAIGGVCRMLLKRK